MKLQNNQILMLVSTLSIFSSDPAFSAELPEIVVEKVIDQ